MKPLCKYFATLMTLIAVVTSNGWHLPIVQGIAWANMYGDYRDSMTKEEALEAVMGGEELCNLCQYVQNSNPAQEQQNPTLLSDKSIPLLAGMEHPTEIVTLPSLDHHTEYEGRMSIRWDDQERPPPKRTLA